MIANDRWQHNWLAITTPGAVRVDLERSPRKRRALERTIRDLQPGTAVVIGASPPRAIRRCRNFASAAGVALDRAYLALPSARTPAYLIEDDVAPLRLFADTLVATPPRTRFSLLVGAALRLARVLKPWRLVRTIAAGSVVVGRRT
jgi:hypothetical protein